MRPRLITAENGLAAGVIRLTKAGFNEAAAHHRGEPRSYVISSTFTTCFNEAAAHHRGELRKPLVGPPKRDMLQ